MKHHVAVSETFTADVQDLRALCFVVDLGSMTLAAKSLGETKGTVSRRITRLERGLGVALLRRSPRLVVATEDGLAYRLRVGRALELLDEASATVRRASATPSGHLRMTAPYDIGVGILAPLVARFVRRYPDISIEVVLTEHLLDFDAQQIDIALRVSSGLADSSLIAHKLERVRGGLYASPEYLRRNATLRSPQDLAQHRLLLVRATRGHATVVIRKNSDGERARVRVRAAISASDYAFAREVALAGGGIAILPDLIALQDFKARRLALVLPKYRPEMDAHLYLVHQGTRLLPPKVQAFRAFVLAAFGVAR